MKKLTPYKTCHLHSLMLCLYVYYVCLQMMSSNTGTCKSSQSVYTLNASTNKTKLGPGIYEKTRRQFYTKLDCVISQCTHDDTEEYIQRIVYKDSKVGNYRQFMKGSEYYQDNEPFKVGGYGRVYMCYRGKHGKHETPETFVVKVVPIHKFNTTEVIVPLQMLGKSENFIKILLVVKEEGCIKIFLPYAEGGTLLEPIPTLTTELRLVIVKCLVTGLEEMHDLEIVHYDVKPENVLLSKRDNKWVAVLIDFGSAKLEHRSLYYGNSSVLNKPPELKAIRKHASEIRKEETLQDFYTGGLLKPVDVYQLGTLMFYMFSGQRYLADRWELIKTECRMREDMKKRHKAEEEFQKMVEAMTSEEVSQIINVTEFPEMPEEKIEMFKSLMNKMLNPDPQMRPTMGDIKNDRLFQP